MEKRTDKYKETDVVRPKKNLDIHEALSSIFLFCFGALTISRGVFWLTDSSPQTIQSDFYASIADWAELWGWGLLFIVSGLIFVLSCYLVPKITRERQFAFTLFIGGGVTAFIYFLIGMAGFAAAQSWLAPTQFMIISGTGLVVCYIGGAKLWKTKR